jgi:UDP-glucose 4-epimerase
MRVLVTGSSGFIGRHVVAGLMEHHEVIEADWPRVDITHRADVARVADGAEAIVHLAAVPVPQRVHQDADDALWSANVDGTRAVCEAAQVRRVVFLSSSCVYGDDNGYVSARHLRPVSLYGASKLAGEGLVTAYAERNQYHYSIGRPVAVFGGGMKRGHVVDFVERYRRDGSVTALDAGIQRKWGVHVADVVDWIRREVERETNVDLIEDLAGNPWGWRDTAKLMGIDVKPGANGAGFVGDAMRTAPYQPLANARPVRLGVQAALDSLGWVRP